MTPKQKVFEMQAKELISAFKKRQMEAYYCNTKEEALNKALELIKEGSVVSWGGSMTLNEIGLLEELKKGNYKLLDRSTAKTPEELNEIFYKAYTADYYLMSSNAITMDGKLINIDGRGNRISALIHGPKNVIIVAGMNKVMPDEDSALKRARNYASPINANRFNIQTPCTNTGRCHDCLSPDTVCCNILVTRMSKIPNRIKVILVGEELGF
ncbi:lactate utilization protein [Defluviitalea phaphyphila]|uniref:lactate utilization protein n=1 Tax=Defluviitalea phaphyphila TaxID=1473580 RepID=UPI000731E27F|nr:lactate utilization protein [Defluviitalea phaphyphila]